MSNWLHYVSEVRSHLAVLKGAGCPDPFFRGQRENWPLLPSLSRIQLNPTFHDRKEARLFFAFRERGAHLMPAGISGWGQLFYMQHYGMPTRLLDWTASFGRALYFALRKTGTAPTIWILDPYALNSLVGKREVSSLHVGFKKDYLDTVNGGFPSGYLAVTGDANIARVRHQQGFFTCAGADLARSMESYCPSALKAFALPIDALDEARSYLSLFGHDEFSTFPDLDGLSRSICKDELNLLFK